MTLKYSENIQFLKENKKLGYWQHLLHTHLFLCLITTNQPHQLSNYACEFLYADWL